jgi:cytidine deaminase
MSRSISHQWHAEVYRIGELTAHEQSLIKQAKKATTTAYAPYSEFAVGCAVLLSDGQVVTGNNQENAAYPSGLCAERVALFYMGANHPNTSIQTLAIAAKPINNADFVFASPCGSCRQVMAEYQQKQSLPYHLLIAMPNDEVMKISMPDLLPLAFSKDNLGTPPSAIV